MKVISTSSTVDLDGPITAYRRGKKLIWLPSEIAAHVEGLPWHVEFLVRPDESGEPTITSVTVAQVDGGPPVSTSMIRQVRLGEALAEAVEQGSWVFELRPGTTDSWAMKHRPAPGGFGEQAVRRGPKVAPDEVRKAAAAFIRHRSTPGDTYQQVADELSVSRATAARYVRRARTQGLIEEEQ